MAENNCKNDKILHIKMDNSDVEKEKIIEINKINNYEHRNTGR